MYCLHPDMAQSLVQELKGDRHEDLLINVHTLIDLPHFSLGGIRSYTDGLSWMGCIHMDMVLSLLRELDYCPTGTLCELRVRFPSGVSCHALVA